MGTLLLYVHYVLSNISGQHAGHSLAKIPILGITHCHTSACRYMSALDLTDMLSKEIISQISTGLT